MSVTIDRILFGAISISILLAAVPAVRSLIGVFGIGICALSFSLSLVEKDFNPNYLVALKSGLGASILILLSYELVSCIAKSLEILRGSQLAEQLFIQERGGPIEFGLLLLLGTLFFSGGGAELVLAQALSTSELQASSVGSEALAIIYRQVLSIVFPLAGLGVVLELVGGLFQRVGKKNLFGAEFSSLRIPLAILFFISLFEEIIVR